MTYRIRPATGDDLPVIVDFNARLAMETEGKALDTGRLGAGVARVLADGASGRYFLATQDDRVAGQLMLTTEWSDWRNGQFWWIQSVYVDPQDRGNGVFRQLFDHVRELARDTPGVCGLRLYFEDNNLRARDAYLRVGLAMAGYQVMEVDFSQPEHSPPS